MANTSARKSTITPVIISVTDDTENEYDNSNAAEAPILSIMSAVCMCERYVAASESSEAVISRAPTQRVYPMMRRENTVLRLRLFFIDPSTLNSSMKMAM